MHLYKGQWLIVVVSSAAVGVITALLILPAAEVVTVALASILLHSATRKVRRCPVTPGAHTKRTRFSGTAGAASAGVGAIGLLAVAPVSTLLLILLLAACSPQALTWLGASSTPPPPLGPPSEEQLLVPEEPHPPPTKPLAQPDPGLQREASDAIDPVDMSDQQLCLAWRASYIALRHTSCLADQLALSTLRATYLVELELRDPGGFAAWIASGARAASDPARFVHPPPRRTGHETT